MDVFYAVFDTNVLVSALMSKRKDSPTVALLDYVVEGRIILLYNEEIVNEYQDVLHRDKFNFSKERIDAVISLVRMGLSLERVSSDELFPDPDDRVFYEVALSKEGAFVVTGNQKHFPKSPIIVTPTEMVRIMDNDRKNFNREVVTTD